MSDDLTELLEFANPTHCPRCGGTQVARIVFGLPTDEDIEDAQEDGDVVFGGCCVDLDAPPFYCKGCDFRWGSEERQRWQEQRAQLSKEQQAKLFRLFFVRGQQAEAEKARRRKERVIQYYRDRHARRHHRQSGTLQVFTVDCSEQLHRIALNERGQLACLDHTQLARIPVTEDSPPCAQILRWWREKSYQLPEPLWEIMNLLRRRGNARRRDQKCGDPLLVPLYKRVAVDAGHACHQARKTWEHCAYFSVTWRQMSVHSTTWHSVEVSMDSSPKNDQSELDKSQPSAASKIKVVVTLAKARRWLHRVHYRGLSVIDGNFVFEVSEILTPDKLKILAARETAPLELHIEPAWAERDASGNWHLQWFSSEK